MRRAEGGGEARFVRSSEQCAVLGQAELARLAQEQCFGQVVSLEEVEPEWQEQQEREVVALWKVQQVFWLKKEGQQQWERQRHTASARTPYVCTCFVCRWLRC